MWIFGCARGDLRSKYTAAQGGFRLDPRIERKLGSVVSRGNRHRGLEQRWANSPNELLYLGGRNRGPRVDTSNEVGEIQASLYGFGMAGVLKGLLGALLIGDIGEEIPTYVRSDICATAYRVDSVKTADSEKLLNGPLGSNRGDLEQNNWPVIGYAPKGLDTSGNLTKAATSDIL